MTIDERRLRRATAAPTSSASRSREVLPRQYTADFRDAGNAVIAAPTVVEDTTQAYRIRITRTAGGDDLQHILVALPTCFTNITHLDDRQRSAGLHRRAHGQRLPADPEHEARGERRVGPGALHRHGRLPDRAPTSSGRPRGRTPRRRRARATSSSSLPGTLHPTLTVLSANVAPVANNDAYSTNEDTTLNVAAAGVLTNDVDTNPLTVAAPRPISAPDQRDADPQRERLVHLHPERQLLRAPTRSPTRPPTAPLESNVATVTITVNAVNDAPVAVNDGYTQAEDSTLVVPPTSGVLANDTDVEDNTLTRRARRHRRQRHARARPPNGAFTYTPERQLQRHRHVHLHGRTTAAANSNIATVTITVTARQRRAGRRQRRLHDRPRTPPLTVAVPGVLGNDTDVDGAGLTVAMPRRSAARPTAR